MSDFRNRLEELVPAGSRNDASLFFLAFSRFEYALKRAGFVEGRGSRVKVREDEVDQEPIVVTPKLTPLSVVLTLDTSGSMKKRLTDAQAAAASFLETLQTADNYGENMAAPPGTYDLYVDIAAEDRLELVAEKVEVSVGKVTEVE
jgi:hypothetical protein